MDDWRGIQGQERPVMMHSCYVLSESHCCDFVQAVNKDLSSTESYFPTWSVLGPSGLLHLCPLGLADVYSPSTITAAPTLQWPSSALTLLFWVCPRYSSTGWWVKPLAMSSVVGPWGKPNRSSLSTPDKRLFPLF